LGREFGEVVVADHVYFVSVVKYQTTNLLKARQTLNIIVGTLGGV
jgi:hypothetical protein